MAFQGASSKRLLLAIGVTLLSACSGGGSGSSGSGSSSGGSSSSSGSSGGSAAAGPYTLTNLVADKANLASDGSASASHVDPNLVNPWGLVFGSGQPSWLSNQGSSTSTLYDGLGDSIPPVVKLPANGTLPASPTGIVFNTGGSTDFVIGSGATAGPANFIFDGLSGGIYGWSEAAGAVLAYSATDGAVYTGLAFANNGSGNFIYAADFKNNKIDVLNNAFKVVSVAGTTGSFPFTDPKLPAGYAPYGIQAITSGGTTQIYVAYAAASASAAGGSSSSSSSSSSSGSSSSSSSSSSSGGYTYVQSVRARTFAANIPGSGLGQVDVFDTSGNFVKTLVAAGGALNGPWGMALAPSDFGALGGDLLVGNFGDGSTDNGSGVIDAFDPATGALVGQVSNGQGSALQIPGLWALAFGNGADGLNQPLNTLFFTAGTNAEADGTYGRIDPGATAPAFTSAVSITAPAASATVSGTVPVTATVQDINAVKQVQFFAGGTSIGTATAAPFTVQWNSSTAANGSVALTATAMDADNNSITSADLSVTVDNAAAPPAAVTLTQLQTQFFTPICSTCHTGQGSSLPGVQNLTAGNSFSNIVNVASIEEPTLDRIKPNDPTNSYLIQKIMGTAAKGAQMPDGCPITQPCLTQAQINMFISWVNAGAQNN